jgi:hypothetical protein
MGSLREVATAALQYAQEAADTAEALVDLVVQAPGLVRRIVRSTITLVRSLSDCLRLLLRGIGRLAVDLLLLAERCRELLGILSADSRRRFEQEYESDMAQESSLIGLLLKM